MKKIKAKFYLCLISLLAVFFLSGCGAIEEVAIEEVEKNDPMPELCAKELSSCFGERYSLSDGITKESHFFDEYKNTEIVTRYTEWALTYQDSDGGKQTFVFNNLHGRGQPSERMDNFIKNHFSDLVEAHYEQKFWNDMIDDIPECQEDSVLYFKSYRLFSYPSVPETSIMFNERLHYSLTDNIYFPQLKYTDVCADFPYLFNLYLYVDYDSADESERMAQRQDTEARLRKMLDAMIQYTGGTLNATAYVIMMDDNGHVDDFSLAVLNGSYFENGQGLEYETALHENFFGAIE